MLCFRGGTETTAVFCMFKFLIINFLVLKVAVAVSAIIKRTRLGTKLRISPISDNSFLKVFPLSLKKKIVHMHATLYFIGIPFLNTVGFVDHKGYQIVSIDSGRQDVSPFQKN